MTDIVIPRISIAMGTFNGERFIGQQLESLAAQSLLPFELIVTDDGSTDNTLEIITGFAATSPFPVTIYRNEQRLGFADNFLYAASLCKGDLIAFCDQDDVWLPAKLIACAKTFEIPGVLLCVHSARIWDGQNFSGNWPNFESNLCLPRGEADILAIYPGFSMVLRQELLQVIDSTHRPINLHSLKTTRGAVAHDQWVWIMASVFGSIVQLADILAHYRQHGANTQGASDQSLKQKIRLTLSAVNYAELSELAHQYALFFQNAAANLPVPRADMALDAARRMAQKAHMLEMRSQIYRNKSNLASRFNTWAKLVLTHGYDEDKSNTKLGRKACVKDAVFGVSGLYRLAQRS